MGLVAAGLLAAAEAGRVLLAAEGRLELGGGRGDVVGRDEEPDERRADDGDERVLEGHGLVEGPEEDEVREDLEPRRRVRVAAVVGERGRAELDDGERAEREEADVEEERVQLRAVVPSIFLQIFFFPLHRTRAPRTSSGGA